jgi:hypothetical protein
MTIPGGGHRDRRDTDGSNRPDQPLPERPAPRGLPRARRSRAPIRQHSRTPRSDLKARLLRGSTRPVEAAWAAIKTPGPLRASYQRVRARRGPQIAIVAVARKLAALSWQLLTKEEDYAFKRSSLVEKKLRTIELRAGAPRRQGTRQVA